MRKLELLKELSEGGVRTLTLEHRKGLQDVMEDYRRLLMDELRRSKIDSTRELQARSRAVQKAEEIRKLAFNAAYRDALGMSPKEALGKIVVLADEQREALKIIHPDYYA